MANRVPSSGTFPYVEPTPQELSVAFHMKNRALILHDRIVWGPEADQDNPKPPSKQQESKSKPSQEGASAGDDLMDASVPPTEGNGDDEDPNRKKPDDSSQRKGDESQDPEEKKEEKEASIDTPESRAEKEAQDRINDLMQKLQEAKDAKAKVEREAKEAAEERARKAGEELIQEIEDEEAAKRRKKEAAKQKSSENKKKKNAPEKGESESDKGEEDNPEGDKTKKEESSKDEPPKDESKEKDEKQDGPTKDEEPTEPWIEVVRRAAKPRQSASKAAEKARARTYPRPMCEATAQGIYSYNPQHVPTRELFTLGRWSVIEKTKDIPATRNPMRLKDNPHKAIQEYGIRRRFTDYKVCILQVLESGKQSPPPGSRFTLDGPDTYWVQTTIQLNEDGTLPFEELPGMFPSLYKFDTFWEIPKRLDGQPLRGITLGVAQYVVGTLELEFRKKPGTSKTFVEKEPFWLNPEAFRAARVLLKEVSSCYHQEDMGVMNWGHAFVYHPSQINPSYR